MQLLLAINWSNALMVVWAGFTIVIIILCLLVLLLLLFNKILTYSAGKHQPAKQVLQPQPEPVKTDTVSVNNDNSQSNDIAAISAALYLYFAEVHDGESNVLTIQRTGDDSAWNAKIFGLNNTL
ncbi:MAG: OadG family protein [Prevotellaceae bacterium]|jgi:Na+-transporting methylmalonyl-CoA/oxaloacetate decarboxylase gamma subunit|nr:OadG family protein [Prevotellaceae bacterium]